MERNDSQGLLNAASRRDFFKVSGAAALAASGAGILSGCGSDGGSGGGGGEGITHSTWNVEASIASFKDIISSYDGPGQPVTVTSSVGDDQISWFNTRVASDTAPDVMTWTYQDMGRFAGKGLIDNTEYIPDGYKDDFVQGYWSGVQQGDGIYGIPLHTAGWATYMNTDILDTIGVDVPAVDDPWDWDKFHEVAVEMKKVTGEYAFSWFLSGTSSRWLAVLYMHGGSVLNSDLTAPAIDSPEGVEAIEWSRKWFADGLMSPDNGLKASKSETGETLFANEQVGMMIASGFKMLALKDMMPKEKWTVGPLFRDVEKANNMGGNALVVTSSAQDPEACAEYIKYMCNKDSMAQFCEDSGFVPARTSLVDEGLDWSYRPDLMQVFAKGSKDLPDEMAALQTMPAYSEIELLLTNQLDLCWTGQQSSADTATAISDQLKGILAKAQ